MSHMQQYFHKNYSIIIRCAKENYLTSKWHSLTNLMEWPLYNVGAVFEVKKGARIEVLKTFKNRKHFY